MTNNILEFLSRNGDDPLAPLFTAAPIMMHSIDSNGFLVNVSAFEASKLGYRPEEMIGRKSIEFLSEESREYAINVALPNFFKAGSMYDVAYDFVRKDGEILPVLMSAIAEYDENGDFHRSIAVLFDNSEAKRVAAELMQSQRMEAIGHLVGGVAHDFNNLLTVIQGNIDLLITDPFSPDREECLHDAYEATRHGAKLTQQLLAFGRKSFLSPKTVKANDVVQDMGSMLRRVIPESVSFRMGMNAAESSIHVDPDLLKNAILNIVNNAVAAMPEEDARLTIETTTVMVSDNYVSQRAEDIAVGPAVMIAVTDNGCGISEENLSKIFEPFFTTNGAGEGSGLGLSMVYGFVKQSNGTIRVYSEPGVGTTFKLLFPAVENARLLQSNKPSRVVAGQLAGAEDVKVFVVEDEAEVRRVFIRMLSTLGLDVTEAASGDKAFEKLDAGYRPDILLTDIVMPGRLQGPALARRAREMIDGLRVVFVSGYPNEAAVHGNGLTENDISFIKPVERNVLLGAISEMVEAVIAERAPH